MSTGQALGFAGMVIGSFFGPLGASIGMLAGTLIGNLIDPPKNEGPRLNDLKLQRSTFGAPIPIVFGKGRIAGNVIDQTDLVEHKQKSGGKGGGSSTTAYTYSASFDILLCEGPIVGISRIWADGRLIWDRATGDLCPCTVYLGSDDQAVDPTFEAIHGVGNVPAYNGFAHCVFTDYYLTDFGNRIPSFEFEVFTKAGGIPLRVSTFDTNVHFTSNNLIAYATYEGGQLTVGYPDGYPDDDYYEEYFDLEGNSLGSLHENLDFVTNVNGGVLNLQVWHTEGLWYQNNVHVATIVANPLGGSIHTSMTGGVYNDNLIYGLGTAAGSTFIATWNCPNGIIDSTSVIAVASATLGSNSPSDYNIGTTNNAGRCYVMFDETGVSTLHEYDSDLILLRSWDATQVFGDVIMSDSTTFHIYGDLLAIAASSVLLGDSLAVYRLADSGVMTLVGTAPMNTSNIVGLSDTPYIVSGDGILSLDPNSEAELLSDVIAAISDRTPLDGAYDVTELENDDVRWFAIGSQMTARNAIQSLRPIFFFDAVEEDDEIVFYKRGGTVNATIDDDDLCAHEDGGELGDPLLTLRTREQALPRTVTMTYYNVDTDYQIGAESSPRQTTLSEQDVTVAAPVGLTSQEAAQKCWAVQSAEWIAREQFEFRTTLKWDKLMPCTVVSVRGREIRVEKKTAQPNGVLSFTGVLSAPSIYTQSAPGSGSGGFVPPEQAGESVDTELVLLDIPILSQHDAPFGFYAAMGPAAVGRWPGATLFKSLDDGVVYFEVAASNVASVIGRTAAAPGSPSVGGALASYGGGDVVDESEICVVLTDADAELESCTATALTNGANLCAISRGTLGSPVQTLWELLQFRDAVLVAERTYVLRGFKRGRKDTSTDGHSVGDRFVLLPVTNVDAPEAELNLTLKYKAVTSGLALADASSQYFTNTGLSTDEFYEVEANHLPIYGENYEGSPPQLIPGLVPAPHADGCDPTYFLNECGDWTQPAGTGGGGSPSSGGGAPVDAQYLVMTSDPDLTAERVAQGSSAVSLTEAGSPGSVVVFDLTDTGVTAGPYGDTNNIPALTIDAKGRITAAVNAPFVGRIITENEGSVVDLDAQVLNFVGAGINAYDDGYGITVVQVNGPFIVLAVAYAASVSVDLAPYSGYAIVVINVAELTGPITFDLTGGTDGQIIRVRFKQDGTGGRTFTAGGHLRFSDDTPSVVLSTAAGVLDHVAFEWTAGSGSPATDYADHVANNLGFH